MNYLKIAKHYDECFKKHGDSNLGVDWPNHEDTLIRHEVMSNMIKTNNATILDYGHLTNNNPASILNKGNYND